MTPEDPDASLSTETTSPPPSSPPSPAADQLPLIERALRRYYAKWGPRLTAYAASLIARQPWRGAYHELPAGAKTAEDFVLEAVALVLEGRRVYDRSITFFQFLAGVVRSLVNHDHDRPENQSRHEFVSLEPENDDNEAFFADWHDEDERVSLRELTELFKQDLPADLAQYVDLLVSGTCETAEEASAALHVPVKKIRNMDKALRRRRPQWKGWPPRPR